MKSLQFFAWINHSLYIQNVMLLSLELESISSARSSNTGYDQV